MFDDLAVRAFGLSENRNVICSNLKVPLCFARDVNLSPRRTDVVAQRAMSISIDGRIFHATKQS